jgi:uncharacterized protein with NAD-binding domain and iron-sulfur cluster
MAAQRFQRAATVSTATVNLFTAFAANCGEPPHGMEITVVSGTANITVKPQGCGQYRTIASTDTPNTWTVIAWSDGQGITSVDAITASGTATITTAPIM